jgi:hypothetical protein
VNGLWLVEEVAELVDVAIWCGKVVKGLCLFAWNFSVTRSTVCREKKEDYTKHDAAAAIIPHS